jgi:tetratricopeptide (TPR) repeat protein/DNA-binding MarR family transcriptional regulator
MSSGVNRIVIGPSPWRRDIKLVPFSLHEVILINVKVRSPIGRGPYEGGGELTGKTIKLTVGDKILILLLDYTRFRGEFQAPVDVTQDGIADKLGIIRSAVPRAVGGLIEKGYVEEYLAHIEGLTRRRKVYMLTDQGIIRSRDLIDEIGLLEIEVEDDNGRRNEPLSNLLSSKLITLESISKVVTNKRLDLRKDHLEAAPSKQSSYTHSLSPPEIFLDREREMEDISTAIRSVRRKVTVIYGIAGVGKTTLAWRISQVFGPEMNVFYMDLKEWTTLNYVLMELGAFLERAGWGPLKDYLEHNREDIESCCDLLKALPRDIPLLAIFDDLHRSPKEIHMFLASFKERLQFMRGTNLIVLSRTRADFYDIRDVKITGVVGELELLGFDRDTSRKFLVERGFPPGKVDEIIARTGGHPLALVLVEKEGGADISDFDNFLRKEIFSKLSISSHYILGLISLSRLQLRDEELLGLRCCGHEDLKGLCDQRLLFYTPSGYIVHDLVRDQAISNMAAHDRERAHLDLAQVFHEKLNSLGFYQEIGTDVPPAPFMLEDVKGLGPAPLFVSEEIHHLLSGNQSSAALRLLIRALLQIPSKDLMNEVSDRIDVSRMCDGDDRILGDFFKAVHHMQKGEYERSVRYLEKVVESAPQGDLPISCRSCANLWIPYVTERVMGPKEALSILDRLETDLDPKLRYYFLTYRASLMYKLGDHHGSSEAYGRFLSAVLDNPEFPAQLKNTIEESLGYAREGQIQKATDNFQRIMELTRLNRDSIRDEMPYVDVDHHLLSAIYSVFYGRNIKK